MNGTRIGLTGTALLALLALAGPAAGQGADTMVVEPMSLSGPRVGFTFITQGVINNVDDLEIREGLESFPLISQFGYQWEQRFFTTPEGGTGVTEWVLLLGGVERNVVLPSLTWLVGYRTPKGTEFGVGPNLSLAGGAWVFAGGVTLSSGSVNFPINLGVAASETGVRVTMLAGFNVASERSATVQPARAAPPVR